MLNGVSPRAAAQRRRRTSGVTGTAGTSGAALAVAQTLRSSAGKGRKGRTVSASAAAVSVSATTAEPTDALAANGHVASAAERSGGPAVRLAKASGVGTDSVTPTSKGRKPAAKRARKATAAAVPENTDAGAPGEAAPLPKAKRSRKTPAAVIDNGVAQDGADANDEPSSAKPKVKRGKKAQAAAAAADGELPPAKPKAKRRKKIQTAAAGADGAAPGDADAGEAAAAKPKKKRTPKVTWPPGVASLGCVAIIVKAWASSSVRELSLAVGG